MSVKAVLFSVVGLVLHLLQRVLEPKSLVDLVDFRKVKVQLFGLSLYFLCQVLLVALRIHQILHFFVELLILFRLFLEALDREFLLSGLEILRQRVLMIRLGTLQNLFSGGQVPFDFLSGWRILRERVQVTDAVDHFGLHFFSNI